MQNNKYLIVQVALYTNKKGDLDSNCKMCKKKNKLQIISWKLILYLKTPIIGNILYYFGQGFS